MKILITGAHRGIGLALAQRLSQRGDEVYGSVRQESHLASLAAHGGHIKPILMDVAEPESIARAAKQLAGHTLDVLINNAGVGEFNDSFENLDFAAGETMLRVNALGPLRVSQAFAAHLRRPGGKVINITSRMGSIADNTSGGAMFYRMSKAALNMASKTLALHWQKAGITVVAVHPGWVQTDMGGARAPTPVDASVRGIVQVIDTLAHRQTGEFVDFEGHNLPW